MKLRNFRSGRALAMAFCVAAFCQISLAQVVAPTILQIDLADYTLYREDVPDPLKYGADPNVVGTTAFGPVRNFYRAIHLADVVAVNGQQAKGSFAASQIVVALRPEPTPGFAAGDVWRNGLATITLEILKSDGTPVGSLIVSGFTSGPPPPGSPVPVSTILQGGHNLAIVGGTGAFLGARGQIGALPPAGRNTSFTEDPVNRRRHGSGAGNWRWIAHVIPMARPEVTMLPTGPAISHSSDFSPVTAAKPATQGEVLSLVATGLGPVVPNVDPGQPFPSSPLANVNSPVEVTVNGKAAEVISAVGYPGAIDAYQVNFRIPTDTAKGAVSIQVSAAWVAGAPVSIPVQ
ncbi:MAG: hypothetical protein JNK87_27795 [Bryobacterales bacterium]|nr:hypothetical protein [Bryobacterales bacterium]